MKKQELLGPGTYVVRVTLRNRITVEEGDHFTETQLAEMVSLDAGSEMVDWEIH